MIARRPSPRRVQSKPFIPNPLRRTESVRAGDRDYSLSAGPSSKEVPGAGARGGFVYVRVAGDRVILGGKAVTVGERHISW